jgi:hypothetical protein
LHYAIEVVIWELREARFPNHHLSGLKRIALSRLAYIMKGDRDDTFENEGDECEKNNHTDGALNFFHGKKFGI